MKRDPNAKKFVGYGRCGCVVWLYSAEFDTEKQAERAIAEAIKDGYRVERMKPSEVDEVAARWGECSHGTHVEDPLTEARQLLLGSDA